MKLMLWTDIKNGKWIIAHWLEDVKSGRSFLGRVEKGFFDPPRYVGELTDFPYEIWYEITEELEEKYIHNTPYYTKLT